jgi:hypothetical protein
VSRSAGILVLTAALGVVAVTALGTDGLAGVAAPIYVPPPPAVGDCITTSVPAFPNYAPDRSVYDTYPQVPIAACDGDRYGEVVALIAVPVPLTVTGDKSFMSIDDPNTGTCWLATSDYLGMTDPITLSGVDWTPSLSMQFQAIAAPSVLQHAAGQRWVACIATPYAYTTPRYSGTLHDAVHTGAARDQTGTCADGTDDNLGSTPGACQQPHTTQLIATGATTGPGTTRAQLDQDCEAVLSQLTGKPDITADGALTAYTLVRDGRGDLSDADVLEADNSAVCGVTSTHPSRTLSGGLIGLGDQPIPWT